MQYTIKHLLHIQAPIEKAFDALSSLEGLSQWWTTDTKGNTAVGGNLLFTFGDYGGPTMKVIKSEAPKIVQWKNIDAGGGWEGHLFTFELDENEGKCRLRFSHAGWDEQSDFFAHCSFSWGRYLESLRQLCQTGKGEAFGSKYYRE